MIAVMTLYVIPRFQDFYTGLDVELPALTRMILGTSLFLRQARDLDRCSALGRDRGRRRRRWSRSTAGRLAIDRVKLRMPLVGPVLHRFAVSEFTRSLATLLSGGIPLVPSLEVATRAVGNHFVRLAARAGRRPAARGQRVQRGPRPRAASSPTSRST